MSRVNAPSKEVAQVSSSANMGLDQMQRIARSFAESKLFGVKTVDEALAIMAICQAEGRHPATAVRDFHIIQGRPALKADTMLARYMESGGTVKYLEYSDAKVSAVFTHPKSGSVTIDWDIERAKRAGLAGRENWKNYPRAMMRARVISEGVRTSFPGIAIGTYTVEEMQDLEPVAVATAVEAAAVVGAVHALSQDETEEHMNAMADAGALEALQTAFGTAWTHAAKNKDGVSQAKFKAAYDDLKKNFERPAATYEAAPL
jgi:hypothetical protein